MKAVLSYSTIARFPAEGQDVVNIFNEFINFDKNKRIPNRQEKVHLAQLAISN